VVTPFEYTAMVWSVIYGWIIWQDWPRVLDWIGIAIIIGSGLYILWRDGARAQD
jgi:drug/metabolite transporter (DMT)-like permease